MPVWTKNNKYHNLHGKKIIIVSFRCQILQNNDVERNIIFHFALFKNIQ
jgi:hypothetical protein